MIKIISKKTWNQLQPNHELKQKLQEVEQNNKIIQSKLDDLDKLQKEREEVAEEKIDGYASISFNCKKSKRVVMYFWKGKKVAGCIQIDNGPQWQISNKKILLELFSALSTSLGKEIVISLILNEKILKGSEVIFELEKEKNPQIALREPNQSKNSL